MKNRILGKDMVVDIGRVYPNDWNPKDNIEESTDNKEYYEAIKEEIEKKGLFEAITVRTTGEGYQILDGYHRWRACSELGYTEIRVNNLGEINDGLARAITLIKEQKKVPISEIKVAEIIKWYKEAGEEDEEIKEMLGYADEVFDDYIKMMDFDFEYDGERGVEEAGEEDSTREVECPKCGHKFTI